ncbi:proline dehydrogenase family protein [candidate division KSB1 bacterium]|nr:proline dehydrogenase family protein [candidate division KSB1 bacterium]
MNWFNNLVAQILPFVPKPFVKIFSQQYIAGENLDDAVAKVKELMSQNICATLDLLGEEVKIKEDALHAVEMYKQILKTIHEQKLDSNISVKPTQMGLKIDKEFCYNNIKSLVEEAKKYNNFVRIDIEDSSCVDDTHEICMRVAKEYDNVGTAIQAYMRRLIGDLNKLIPMKINLRICKGAYYWEPRSVVYKDGSIINDSYDYAMEKLLSNGCYVAVATHDEKLVFKALSIVDKYSLEPDQYEFQMLYGVDRELRKIIVESGHRLRVYVPFGKEWFAYSIRRLKENPKMVSYIIKNTFLKITGRA